MRVPVRIPAVLGANLRDTMQKSPGANVPMHRFWLIRKSPFTEVDLMVSGAFPALEKKSGFDAPVVAISRCPKSKLPEPGDNCPETPCPKKFTICGVITALSFRVILPNTEELSVGENVTVIGQMIPG